MIRQAVKTARLKSSGAFKVTGFHVMLVTCSLNSAMVMLQLEEDLGETRILAELDENVDVMDCN